MHQNILQLFWACKQDLMNNNYDYILAHTHVGHHQLHKSHRLKWKFKILFLFYLHSSAFLNRLIFFLQPQPEAAFLGLLLFFLLQLLHSSLMVSYCALHVSEQVGGWAVKRCAFPCLMGRGHLCSHQPLRTGWGVSLGEASMLFAKLVAESAWLQLDRTSWRLALKVLQRGQLLPVGRVCAGRIISIRARELALMDPGQTDCKLLSHRLSSHLLVLEQSWSYPTKLSSFAV